MKTIYDRASIAHTLTLDLNPDLRAILKRRFASLHTRWGDLSDHTEFVIVEQGDREADIIDAIGMSPLLDPDGGRFGNKGFHPFWDHLDYEDGHWVMIVSFGSAFAYILIIPNADGVIPELQCLCRMFAEA
ncbi:hypothetical protein [Sphingomonas bacterium]|uniref:hypothetical protein n=1 Tax=Sphingomonas bacterium TaxID=1895847 RepID=UPI00157570A9|nr:hypothetical protein [Sphingomonas bacterium]